MVEQNQCRAPLLSLKVDCLLEAARQNCRDKYETAQSACEQASDVMISNRLGATALISRTERLDLLESQGRRGFRQALENLLRTRYAGLVVEMSMSVEPAALGDDQLPATIDSYCRTVSGTRELSWQHCASAVVWFVATADRTGANGTEMEPR